MLNLSTFLLLLGMVEPILLQDWKSDMLALLQVKRRDLISITRCFEYIWSRLFEPVERGDKIKGEFRRKCAKVSRPGRKFSIQSYGKRS